MPDAPGNAATDFEDRPIRIQWTVVFLAFTAAGVLRFTYLYLDDVTRSVSGTALQRILEESTGAYAAMLLFPLVAGIERTFPLSAGRWRRNWSVHLLMFTAYSVAHTTMLAASRSWLFALFGQDRYYYGRMPTRYFMEAPQDVISYLAFIGALTFIRVQYMLRDREVRAAALERDAATARLEVLSLRLQPHFLFNALNTISSAVYDDPVAADMMIGRLGDLLRHALRTSDRQEIAVHEELDNLKAYLTFVDARFGDRIRCSIDVDPGIKDMAVPGFLLQPLVENAVRHGSAMEFRDSDIVIALKQSGKDLAIMVENDIDRADTPTPRVGTGLSTTRDRLQLLYGDAATFAASAIDGRFRVLITLPASPFKAQSPGADPSPYASADR
jgi:two-component system, LytTR family, sensor kinase